MRAALDEFLRGYDSSRYPEPFLKTYEPMECFSNSPFGETLLVKSRQTGDFYVAKCYTEPTLLSHITEGELLKTLHLPGIPAFTGEYRGDKMLCVVREYAQGTPLDRYILENRPGEQQIIAIALQLCDILSYLHGQSPPVIHRDIKPQNVIIDGNGAVTLIDFGISRVFDETAQTDTVFWGTQEFAAPEQYGFSQTDRRADIFSLGVLLCWMLTGETRMEKAADKIGNRRLAAIIRKCVSFSPKDRYPGAQSVRKALENADGHRQKRIRRVCCAAFALFLSMLSGFALGRYTQIGAPEAAAQAGVVFSEPLIEQAVRLSLSKSADEQITQEELLSITEMYVFGDKAASDEASFSAYSDRFAANDGTVQRGGIRTLNDIAKMKNLKTLCLACQDIRLLAPLEQCEKLERIELKHNPLQDVSPLSGLMSLRSLSLFDTNVSDLTCLRACTRLVDLDAGNTQIQSLSALEGLYSLQTLSLHRAPLESLNKIDSYIMLEKLDISKTRVLDLTPALDLPRLKTVVIDEGMQNAASASAAQAAFEVSYRQ